MKNTEHHRIEEISKESQYSQGIMKNAIEYCYQIFNRYGLGQTILELGPAEGIMSELLAQPGIDLTMVEGSSLFCADLKKRFPTATVVNSLFEEFVPTKKYQSIILGHVLEHVNDPVLLLKRIKNWLVPGSGRLFAAVPNSRSIHRQAAVILRMLDREDSLNSKDLQHGHRRVFDPERFRSIFIEAGMNVDIYGGYWLKPLSNTQIEESWNQEMISAFMKLGERYPDIAAEIYVVASFT
jgi:2-polyprenyl-3-methyl-5-hydroxy-6-metoxy-1,4-benzoquinol methylase